MQKISSVDVSPYGFQAVSAVDSEGIGFVSAAYRHSSGLGFGAAVSGKAGWSPLTASVSVKSMQLVCGTRHRLLVVHIAAILGGVTLSLSTTSGKRNDELVARIVAARDAMAIADESELFMWGGGSDDDNTGEVKG